MKYWEIVADNLSKAGSSWDCVSAVDSKGLTIWIADAHRDDRRRFIVHADEKLSAFVELESAICACGEFVSTGWRVFSKLGVAKRILNQAEDISPAGFFVSSGPAIPETSERGKKGRTI